LASGFVLIDQLDADDRADLFICLAPEEQQRLLSELSQDEQEDIRRLLTHREGTAAAIMTSDFAKLIAGMTASEAIEALRRQAPSKETIYRSYVLDSEGRLVGSVQLHELILAAADTPLAEIIEHALVSITVDANEEEAARQVLPLGSAQCVTVSRKIHAGVTGALLNVHSTQNDFLSPLMVAGP
jgi:magnesium transporter